MEITEIKSRLSLAEVLSYYGLKPDKHLRLHCPFHEDKTPSLQIYYKTDTVYCFSANCTTHGKSLDQIDFIMYKENCTKSEAIQKARALIGAGPKPQFAGEANNKIKIADHNQVATDKASLTRIAVLSKLMQESKQSLGRSGKGQAYCKARGLEYSKQEIGFLEERYHRSWNETLKQNALEIGLIKEQANKTLSPHFRNCLIFPIKNREGQIVSIYGRSIIESTESKHFYLKGKHQGLYPGYPNPETQTLILTESIIDAATLLQFNSLLQTPYSLLSCYGTNGLTQEQTEAVSQLKDLKEIIIFFDGDEAGKAGTEKLAEKLKTYHVPRITFVNTPEGEDINSLLQSHEPEIFQHLLETRTFLSSNEREKTTGNKQDAPGQSLPIADCSLPVADCQFSVETPNSGLQAPNLNTTNPDKISYHTDQLLIEIWGGIENNNLHRLKLSLYLENKANKQTFRDDVNLYSNRSLKQFLQDASEELEISQTELKHILQEFTRAVETYRLEQREKEQSLLRPEKVLLNQLEQEEALKHLKDKHLVKNLRLAMQKTGLIGETDSGLLLFLIFLTRYFENPLHALVHGSSGSGKTNLLKTILKLVPEESKYETTALSENVLFRPPYKSFWKNKILLLEDLDGSYKALLPLREFMTAQKISKFVTESDPKTGAFKQVRLQAEGPVCIAGATTKDKVYEDNSNRSFLIHVNESKAHQEAVLDYQNKQAAGLINKEVIEHTADKVHNLQRMLNPKVKVINPFQPYLKLPEYVFKKLRTNTHYITLIQSITFLHQYQRDIKQNQSGVKYIETTLEDVELANQLSKESLLRKSDELSGAVREFFEALKYTVRQSQKETFTAKQIREQFRMHPMQLKRRLDELTNRGYIKLTGGNRRISFEYEVCTWDDYQVLQDALKTMDEILANLWQQYPDGKYVKQTEKS